jgi:para-nitrobenzyl esterase
MLPATGQKNEAAKLDLHYDSGALGGARNRTGREAKKMRRMIFGAILLVALFAASSDEAQITSTPIAPIRTNEGRVAGKVLASGVRAWLGVPFAKPPINDLRWRPPQPISWEGVWTADRKMPECMQVLRPHNINNYFGEEATSEDCLYLNVWAPPGSKAGQKLPVIVFIYGGGGTIGSAGSPMYDGENLAKKGVVFVTMGYRLGILGWMAHPELTKEQGGHSGDYAYLDQNAALKWVHNNIALFGGDPARVTITGQSAGAGAVSAQLHSPLSKGLFWAAMMSSTCSIGTPGEGVSLAEGEKTGLEIQKRLGVSDLEHMRYVAADRLIALQNEGQVGYNITTGVRTGAIVDGYFTTKSKEDMAKSHEMSDVPVIANFNSGESFSPLQKAKTVAEYQEIAAKLYGKDVDEFLKLYPVSQDSDVSAVASKVARESSIANASRNCGVFQAEYNKSKVYIDMFDRKQPYVPGVEIADQDPATIGAYHNGDVPYWFANLDIFNLFRHTREWTAWDHTLSDDMSGALIAFAKTGDPSTPAVKWPAWSKTDDVFVDFGNTVKVEKFYTEGMSWLAVHQVQGGRGPGGGAGAPGVVTGTGPRD